jgi:hypothetical protein
MTLTTLLLEKATITVITSGERDTFVDASRAGTGCKEVVLFAGLWRHLPAADNSGCLHYSQPLRILLRSAIARFCDKQFKHA